MIIGFSLLVIVLTLLMWPIGAMIRRHYSRSLPLNSNAKRLRLLVRFVCLDIVFFSIGMLIIFSMLNDLVNLSTKNDLWIHVLQVLGYVAGLGALVAIYNSAVSWKDNGQWFWTKVWNTLLAIACVGFFWFIYQWNLLNFNLNY